MLEHAHEDRFAIHTDWFNTIINSKRKVSVCIIRNQTKDTKERKPQNIACRSYCANIDTHQKVIRC